MTTAETVAEHGAKIEQAQNDIKVLWEKYDRIMWLLVGTLLTSVATFAKVTFFGG